MSRTPLGIAQPCPADEPDSVSLSAEAGCGGSPLGVARPAPRGKEGDPDRSRSVSDEADRAAELAAQLVEDMAAAWARGERPCVEDFLALFPALRSHDEAVTWLLHTEIALGRQRGEEPDADALARRFPERRDWIAAMLGRG